jgi:hypothetical protein
MSDYLKVDPTEPQGEDEGSPENAEGVRRWLLDNTDDMPLEERINLAEEMGLDDVVGLLKTQPK